MDSQRKPDTARAPGIHVGGAQKSLSPAMLTPIMSLLHSLGTAQALPQTFDSMPGEACKRLFLRATQHHLFDCGTIYLVPYIPNDKFDRETTRCYDLQSLWRSTIPGLLWMTRQPPLQPNEPVNDLPPHWSRLAHLYR